MAEEMKEEPATEEEVAAAEEAKLAFPTAAIVREMKRYVAKDKMIRKEVKVAMNKFLAEVVKDVSEQLDKNPYAMLDYRMFEEAIRPYKQIKEMQAEKKRLVSHLDAIVEDCASIKRDLDLKFPEQPE
jgi:hypothetical protein